MRIYGLTNPDGDEIAVHYTDGAAVIATRQAVTGNLWSQIELPDDELERLTVAILATIHGMHPRQYPAAGEQLPELEAPAPHEVDGARFAAIESARELVPDDAGTVEVLGVAHWLLTGEIPPITAEQLRPAVSA